MNIKRHFIATTAIIGLALPSAAFAADEYNVSTGITTGGVPLAVHGMDTVVLSNLNAVAYGAAAHSVTNDGVAYYFASKASADMFQADPEKYMPQYGGFCAYAVALGKKFDGDPRFADIVDGKLYLFVNAAIFEKYKQDKENVLKTAAEVWPKIKHTPIGDL